MQDIRRSLMIFRLKEASSEEELQKAYKKLVKKYHPDFNQDNQEWSHRKMTEINLAYEHCREFMKERKENPSPRPEPAAPGPRPTHGEPVPTPRDSNNPFAARRRTADELSLSASLTRQLRLSAASFCSAADRFFEYGLENRRLRTEGVRRFRYRESLRGFREAMSLSQPLEGMINGEYDRQICDLYLRFIEEFCRYIQLDDRDIPRHPSMNPYWYKMEGYLTDSLKDYLAPYLTNRFGRVSWQVQITHCWNLLNYLKRKFPGLEKEEAFLTVLHLADSYREIRAEEETNRVRFFSR